MLVNGVGLVACFSKCTMPHSAFLVASYCPVFAESPPSLLWTIANLGVTRYRKLNNVSTSDNLEVACCMLKTLVTPAIEEL